MMKTLEERITAIKIQQAKLAEKLEKLQQSKTVEAPAKTVKTVNEKLKGIAILGFSQNVQGNTIEWSGRLTGICWISNNPAIKGDTLAHMITKNRRLFIVNLSRFTGTMGSWIYENGKCQGRIAQA